MWPDWVCKYWEQTSGQGSIEKVENIKLFGSPSMYKKSTHLSRNCTKHGEGNAAIKQELAMYLYTNTFMTSTACRQSQNHMTAPNVYCLPSHLRSCSTGKSIALLLLLYLTVIQLTRCLQDKLLAEPKTVRQTWHHHCQAFVVWLPFPMTPCLSLQAM